jgi:hypothetical protein
MGPLETTEWTEDVNWPRVPLFGSYFEAITDRFSMRVDRAGDFLGAGKSRVRFLSFRSEATLPCYRKAVRRGMMVDNSHE